MRPFLAALLAAPAAAAWKPAQPTLGVMNIYAAARLPPQPTSAPKLSDLRLAKRADADQTCGYIDGDSDNPLTCGGTATCVVDDIESYVGCCGDSCAVPSTCLPQESSIEGENADPASTLWCSDDNLPACATMFYLDDTFSGYIGYFCDVTDNAYDVFYTATDGGGDGASLSTDDGGFTSTEPGVRPTRPAQPTTTPLPSGPAASDPASPGSPAAANSSSKSSSSSGPPIGAVVGGVVGGIAVLGMIGLGIFFVVRNSNKNRRARPMGPPMGPPMGGPGGPPGGGGSPSMDPKLQVIESTSSSYNSMPPPGPLGPGAGHYDPRTSVAKPPAAYDPAVLGSPPPQYPGPVPAPLNPDYAYGQQQQQQQQAEQVVQPQAARVSQHSYSTMPPRDHRQSTAQHAVGSTMRPSNGPYQGNGHAHNAASRQQLVSAAYEATTISPQHTGYSAYASSMQQQQPLQQQHTGYSGYGPSVHEQQQQQQHQHQQYQPHAHVAELPTMRGDGNLQELA